MKILIVACAILATVKGDSHEHGTGGTGVNPTCNCGWANRDSGRIVNGEPTKEFEYPMLAGIVFTNRMLLFCGGTVISNKHVLTAAHCLDNWRPQHLGIHVGSNSYEKVKWQHGLYQVESFTQHPQWSRANLVYDIAVMTIEGEFWKGEAKIGSNVGPACLPRAKLPLVGQQVKVLGWGKMWEGGPASPSLLQVNLHVKPHQTCHANNPKYEKKNIHQICTFTPNKDSCQGDSGGPLLWNDRRTNRYTLVAATSYGLGCARYPAVNTDVAHFRDWIDQQVKKTGPGSKTCSI